MLTEEEVEGLVWDSMAELIADDIVLRKGLEETTLELLKDLCCLYYEYDNEFKAIDFVDDIINKIHEA